MKRRRGQTFEELLARQLRNKEVRFLFDERRFYLQIARLECGDRQRTPTFDTVFKVLKALGYSLELSARADPRLAA